MRALAEAMQTEPKLSRPVIAVLGIASMGLAILCYLLVRRAIEPGDTAAEWGLSLLFLGAMSGFMLTFDAIVRLALYLCGRAGRPMA